MSKEWLLKKKNQILGPYSLEELEALASEGKISISKDQVNHSLDYWVYAYVIPELKEANSSRDIVHTLITKTISRIQTSTQPKNKVKQTLDSAHTSKDKMRDSNTALYEEKTQTHTSSPVTEEEEVHIRKTSYSDLLLSTVNSDPTHPVSYKKVSSVYQDKRRIQSVEKVSRFQSYLFQITIILALFGAGIYFLKDSILVSGSTEEFLGTQNITAEDQNLFLTNAQARFNSGRYEEALNLFRTASVVESNDLIKYASLVLQVDQDIYKAKELLDQVSESSTYDIGRYYLLKALIAIKEQDTNQATFLLKKAQRELNPPGLSLIHLSYLDWQNKNLKSAYQYLNAVSQEEVDHFSLATLLKFFYSDQYNQAKSTLDLLSRSQVKYSQEASILSLYLFSKDKTKTSLNQKITQTLDRDPYITFEHYFDILSFKPTFIWKTFLKDICLSIHSSSQSRIHFYNVALSALCLMQSGFIPEATEKIRDALELAPRDPLIHALYGYIYLKSNFAESILHIDYSLQYNKGSQHLLPHILKARVCEDEEDYICSDNHWNIASRIRGNTLSVLAAKIRTLLRKGLLKEAQKQLDQASALSPQYLPFQDLRSKLE